MAVDFPSNPTNGQTITVSGITYAYDSTQGVWSDNPQGLTQAIDALTDVDTSTSAPANGQILQWNSTDSEWQPADSSAGVTVYATIDDLPLTGVTEGSMALVDSTDKLYIFSDAGWYSITLVNITPSISGVSATYTLATDGTATTVTVTATDPEGIPLTYSIVSDTSGNIATVAQGTGSNTNQWTITPSTNSTNAGSFTLVFRASDGTNIASASSTFVLGFVIENSNYTTALITSVGANNAVNNSFDDASTNNHTITANGNVTQSTFSPHRHSGYSTYISGGNDQNLYIASNTATAVESGDFTLEAWCWFDDPDEDEDRFIYTNFASWGANAFLFGKHSATAAGDGKVVFWVNNNDASAPLLVDPNMPSAGWIHYCVTRSGNTFTLYRNGSSVATATSFTGAVTGSSNISYVGEAGDGIASFKGYLRDVRLIKGTAVTPPSGGPTEPLTAVTNTGLLTCHLPYIADGSTNSHPITVNGNIRTEPFSPYDHNGYSASSNGGSMYFDGTGDYLSVPADASFAMGTGAFTWEFWLYLNSSTGASQNILDFRNGSAGLKIEYDNAGRIDVYSEPDSSTVITGSTAISLKIWYHVALTRDSSNNLRLFINGKQDGSTVANHTSNYTNNSGRIGCHYTNITQELAGILSDVRILKGSAEYTADFAPPTSPLTAITNTSLLLNGTDAAIIDKSQSVKTITLNGDVKSSESEYKFLTSSIYFDGTGDFLTVKDTDEFFDFGVGQFTVEFWLYKKTSGAQVIIDARSSVTATPWLINISWNGRIQWYDGASYTGTNTVALNTWTHFAVTRDSNNTLRVFKGGVVEHTTNSYTADLSAHSQAVIGARCDGAASLVNGYISDLRITKGLARYTSNFTEPTAALGG